MNNVEKTEVESHEYYDTGITWPTGQNSKTERREWVDTGEYVSPLFFIQQNLVVPKTRFNKFGEFWFRSTEDIIEAVKPLLESTGCTLKLADKVVAIGDAIYMRSKAKLTSATGEKWSAKGFARDAQTKKGMDAAQVTGTSSSYARKYALNGLFCLDDSTDADRAKQTLLSEQIEDCASLDELRELYKGMTVADRSKHRLQINVAKERLGEEPDELPELTPKDEEKWAKAVAAVKLTGNLDQVLQFVSMSDENQAKLRSEANVS